MTQAVVCLHEEQSLIQKAQQLAQFLQWPWLKQLPFSADLVLLVEPTHLALALPNNPQFKPLYLDLAAGQQAYRLQHLQHEPLIKVCRVKGLTKPLRLIDATAGLGKDALLLAAWGAEVVMLEQHPVLYCLLNDVLERVSRLGKAFSLQLHHQNALDYLPQAGDAEVIYLDPMFDHDDSKTALVKKDMQILQKLAQPPSLAEQVALLDLACAKALHKVVVKRARLSPPLGQRRADYHVLGKHSRFDVYLTNRTV